jgi:uncharacterized protein (DUF1800 family)
MRKLLIPILLVPALVVGAGKSGVSKLFDKKLPNDQKALHALNRLTFGPRPGDVEAVRKTGLKKWVDLQLHPSQIAENPELLAKLEPLDTLRMTTQQMNEHYPTQQALGAMARGMRNEAMLPKDPVLRARFERVGEMYKKRINRTGTEAKRPKLDAILDPDQVKTLRSGTDEQRVRLLMSLPEEKLGDVVAALPPDVRRPMFQIPSLGLRRKLLVSSAPPLVPGYDLNEGKLLRAIYSNRQLEEVLVDFWYNHFNVFIDKGNDRFLVTSYERDSIRPHVLGKFKDMLLATAQDPAMLFYLDNWQSVAAKTPEELAKLGARARFARGLNENYARELLELHTLGVDGGYTQKDIIAVARCFTGWTIQRPYQFAGMGSAFEFNDKVHDKGEKLVLGVTIPAGGGKEDGLKVLDILVHHPSTAHFISKKLAQRFVADDPPPVLIDRMARTFREKDGDLREVMKTMLASKEFWSQGAWHAKMKSPLEMIASAIRATGADVQSADMLANQLQQLGEPLYRKVEPTGYSSANAEWTNSAALLARMNFALALAQNKAPGLKVDTSRFEKLSDPQSIARSILFTNSTPETQAAISKDSKEPAKVAGLVIGSPEFQRR